MSPASLPAQIRIWGRPTAIAAGQGDYALNVTGSILRFFEEHYNTSYPLPKSGGCCGVPGALARGATAEGEMAQQGEMLSAGH